MTPLFAIPVHDIDAGGLARSFDLPLVWLEQALVETGLAASEPGHADLRLSKTGNDIIVRGKVRVTISEPCARCLRPATFPLDGELSLLLRPARSDASHGAAPAKHAHHATPAAKDAGRHSAAKGGTRTNGATRRPRDDEDEYEFSSDEADLDTYDGELVVLDGFLREALLLEAPSFPLCSEDCPGIRPAPKPAPAREEPIDPRLSPLRELKTKLKLAPGPDATSTLTMAPGASDEGPSPLEGEPGAPRPATRAARPEHSPRPKIHAHRTAGARGGKNGAKKSKPKVKVSPQNKAK